MYSPLPVVSICMAALLAMSPTVTFAESAPSDGIPFSIRAAFDSALVLSPEAQSRKKRLEALMAKREAASALFAQAPALEGSYRSDRNTNQQGLREIELGFSVPLWNWNERSSTQSLRDSELVSAQAQDEASKLELAAEVRQLVWDTLSAQVDVDLAHTRVQSAKKLLDDVARRVEAGELARTDLYQAQALHVQSQSEAVRATVVLSDLGSQFSSTTGLPVSVLRDVQPEPAILPEGFQALIHPQVSLAQAQLQSSISQAELVLSQKRTNPELGLAIVSDRAALGASNEKSLVLSTRIPLGNSSEYQGRVLDAQARQLEAQASLSKIQRSIASKSRAAASNLAVFKQLKHTASEQAELAQRVYALYQQSFELGETDLPTLLRYGQQFHEAERLARKSDIEYAAMVSAYRQAHGLLPE